MVWLAQNLPEFLPNHAPHTTPTVNKGYGSTLAVSMPGL